MGLLDAAAGGYAAAFVQSIVALVGVCALAVLVLRLAAKRGLGRSPVGRTMELVERLPLDHHASVCVVRVDGRRYLLGVSDRRAPRLIAELGDPHASEAPVRPFRELLADGAGPAANVSVGPPRT